MRFYNRMPTDITQLQNPWPQLSRAISHVERFVLPYMTSWTTLPSSYKITSAAWDLIEPDIKDPTGIHIPLWHFPSHFISSYNRSNTVSGNYQPKYHHTANIA